MYFSLFQYPLTEEEIYAFSEVTSRKHLRDELEILLANKVIFKIDQFYLCENNEALVKRRILGNRNAEEIAGKALRVSKFISKFPFVEGVGISGSLSKGYFDEDGDIDFFIITKHRRLWIARTFLILYKKIFLFNNKKYFCVNYFISENSLEIVEKNRFTATELVTMMPMYGNGSFKRFYEENQWALSFLPNQLLDKQLEKLRPAKKPFFSIWTEKILNTKIGDSLDSLFLKITYKKWKVKFTHLDDRNFDIALKSTKDVSKHHPLNFQNKVIQRLNIKYAEYQENHDINLTQEHA